MKAELLIPLLVVCAIVTAVLIVAAVSGAKHYANDNGPVWNDDDYDGWGSY